MSVDPVTDPVEVFARALLEWSTRPCQSRRDDLMRAANDCRTDRSVWPPLMRLGVHACDTILQSHQGHPRLRDLRQVAAAVGAALLADRRRQREEEKARRKSLGLVIDLEGRRG